MALNLEKQLLFYGAYHNNPVNVAIHITCVPILLFTGIVLACNCPPLFTLPDALQIHYLPANAGTIGALIYAIFYVLLEPIAGGLLAPAVIAAAYYGNYFLGTYGNTVNYWAGGIHIVSWLAQFVGHGAFEKRAPALLDNLVQAILLAPLFVWMEVLFFFGYRPELQERFEKGVELEILKFRNQQGHEKEKGKAKGKGKAQ
ncbi:hypothetical protein N7499_004634 [Penicillium canescens]|nr:uncharacterized protein N7446_004869 [Penicillium canescens]KAJ6009966.1 hypothetical protein N7522_004982 [Penicillium canescens]KAJ6039815.1 hypothetical protein N7444_008720 [Penicillium canescens]KAJ6067832.1 hypothetical protein N7446_004869 [Penicillium canescens]KAJ6085005.1 hypothetical protein N7499_004634 [Penicillium canescens]